MGSVWIAGSYQSDFARNYARMLHDAARQATGQVGYCQVEGARTFATLNIGGSLTTTVSFIVAGPEKG